MRFCKQQTAKRQTAANYPILPNGNLDGGTLSTVTVTASSSAQNENSGNAYAFLNDMRGSAILSFPNSLNRMAYSTASYSLKYRFDSDRYSQDGADKRYNYKRLSRNSILGATKKVLDKIAPVERKAPPMRYWKTDFRVNVASAGGIALGAYNLYKSGENIANAENKAKQTFIEGGGWTGAIVGAEAAAPIAAAVAPFTGPFAPVTAIVIVGIGGAVGSVIGTNAATGVADDIFDENKN